LIQVGVAALVAGLSFDILMLLLLSRRQLDEIKSE
jgi:hypothetical protein